MPQTTKEILSSHMSALAKKSNKLQQKKYGKSYAAEMSRRRHVGMKKRAEILTKLVTMPRV